MRDERMRNFRGPVAPICASLHMDNKRRLKKKTEKKGVITFSPTKVMQIRGIINRI